MIKKLRQIAGNLIAFVVRPPASVLDNTISNSQQLFQSINGLQTVNSRFAFIDGLRGIAALGVVLFHFTGHRLFEDNSSLSFDIIRSACRFGDLGVPIFFVISGFVIAHSISAKWISRAFFFNFVVRRVIRLDPPYWFAIAFIVATTVAGNELFPSHQRGIPTLGNVIAHMFYVYPLFGYAPIEAVFWTLVHEVQFYLLYLVLISLIQRFGRSIDPGDNGVLLLIGIPAVISSTGFLKVQGLCFDTWYLFSMGVLAYSFHRLWIRWSTVFLVLACVSGSLLLDPTRYKYMGLLTVFALISASQLGGLATWLRWKVFQFFGQISYSLYLIHGAVGWRLLSVGDSFSNRVNFWPPAWLVAAVGLSVLAAWLMRVFIEVPGLRLAKRLKLEVENSSAFPFARD